MVPHVLFNIFDVPVCTINFHFIQTVPLETSFSQIVQSSSMALLNQIILSPISDKFIPELINNCSELIEQNRLDCCTYKATLSMSSPPTSFYHHQHYQCHKCDENQPYLLWSFGQLVNNARKYIWI